MSTYPTGYRPGVVPKIVNGQPVWEPTSAAQQETPVHYEMSRLKAANIPDLVLPTWETSPLYTAKQNEMSQLGSDILSGNIPDYYKGIGETNSPEYQRMLANTLTDTKRAVNEALASRNINGGQTGVMTADAISRVSGDLGYQDYNRAMAGKQNLLTLGSSLTESVRNSAQTLDQLKNAFNQSNTQIKSSYDLSKAQISNNFSLGVEGLRQSAQQINDNYMFGLISAEQRDRQLDLLQEQIDAQNEANDDSFWSSIIGGGISLLTGDSDSILGRLLGLGSSSSSSSSSSSLSSLSDLLSTSPTSVSTTYSNWNPFDVQTNPLAMPTQQKMFSWE